MVIKEILFKILDFFDQSGITYWLDGGWGVDALYGEQTREHRDVDIDFDSAFTNHILDALQKMGYVLATDQLPVRAELKHTEYGFLDIHPFDISNPAHIKQIDPTGGFWKFEPEWFGETIFEGRKIPCITLAGQKIFHTGYEPREQDIHDLALLERIERRQMNAH